MLPIKQVVKPEIEQAKRESEFLGELMGSGFYDNFQGYVMSSTRFIRERGDNLVSAFAIFNSHIKRLYGFFVEELGWPKEQFVLILWNICHREENNPFSYSVYYDYERKFLNGELEDIRYGDRQ